MAETRDLIETEAVARRYAKRGADDRYYSLSPSVYLARQEVERGFARFLGQKLEKPANAIRLLEVGCGSGINMLAFLALGLSPSNLVGIELLPERALAARARLPASLRVIEGDASTLQIEPESFDVVLQSTVFTSLLDTVFQAKLARQMWSWVKPGGGILWYDFVYDNPRNQDVRGVSRKRVAELFPGGSMDWRRLTLAPPICRRVSAIHPVFRSALNSVPWLRTHILAWIAK